MVRETRALVSIEQTSGRADTAAQGALAYQALVDALKRPGLVVIDFAGVTTATSSFTNLAFVQLLSNWKLAEIKKRLRVVNSTRQINEMIKSRLEREGKRSAAA
jgi:hypothetical protein